MDSKIEEILRLFDDEKARIELIFDRYADGAWKSLIRMADEVMPNDPERPSKQGWWERERCDLAFRLRDEAVTNSRANWRRAQHLVVSEAAEIGEAPPLALPETWWADFARAEHYIVAALIARELQKQTEKEIVQ